MTLDVQTLDVQTWIEDLLAYNRERFGDLRMEADDETPDDETPDGNDDPDAADKAAEEKAAADALGDEKDWKAEFEAQRRVNRDLERRSKQKMRELEQKLAAAAKQKPEGEDKPDLDAIRKQIRDEVSAENLKDKALDKIEAKAARLFQKPEDARTFLAENVEDFIDGGKVDLDAINDALADLLSERPYLGVTQGDEKKFKGGADAGARGKASKSQLTEADVKKLAADGKHAEIEQARVDGRLNELLGIK